MALLLFWVLCRISGLPAGTEHAEHPCKACALSPALSAHRAHDVRSHCVCNSQESVLPTGCRVCLCLCSSSAMAGWLLSLRMMMDVFTSVVVSEFIAGVLVPSLYFSRINSHDNSVFTQLLRDCLKREEGNTLQRFE